MAPQVPKVWLVSGASWVFLGSVVREDSLACLARRVSPASKEHQARLETEVLLAPWVLPA